jgi:hypothetical protein
MVWNFLNHCKVATNLWDGSENIWWCPISWQSWSLHDTHCMRSCSIWRCWDTQSSQLWSPDETLPQLASLTALFIHFIKRTNKKRRTRRPWSREEEDAIERERQRQTGEMKQVWKWGSIASAASLLWLALLLAPGLPSSLTLLLPYVRFACPSSWSSTSLSSFSTFLSSSSRFHLHHPSLLLFSCKVFLLFFVSFIFLFYFASLWP